MLAPELTPEDFVKLRDDKEETSQQPILLDVREPWESATATIPGATAIPMGEITSRAHAELDPDLPYVVFCHHGARSLSVTMWLRNQGFEHVQSLAGGIDGYARAVDPTIPLY